MNGLVAPLLAASLVLHALPSHAIILHAWTFEELASVSDAVLIVERVGLRDTGRWTPWPRPGSSVTATPPLEAVEWEADLRVLLQLRPAPGGDAAVPPVVRLRYYRVETPGGCLGCVATIDLTADEGRHYLVFLKRVSGDVYEPASRDSMPIDSIFSLEHTGGSPIHWEDYLPSEPPPPANPPAVTGPQEPLLQEELPSEENWMVVVPGARDLSRKSGHASASVSYEVKEAYPAISSIALISDALSRNGWTLVEGGGFQEEPVSGRHAWEGLWRDGTQFEVRYRVVYACKYEHLGLHSAWARVTGGILDRVEYEAYREAVREEARERTREPERD